MEGRTYGCWREGGGTGIWQDVTSCWPQGYPSLLRFLRRWDFPEKASIVVGKNRFKNGAWYLKCDVMSSSISVSAP
jgi:hypothetical protein